MTTALPIANGRSVAEWVGATPDTVPPPRVRLRTFDREQGKCHICGRKIHAGERWTHEHRIALINGGQNREFNLTNTCDWCLPEKNADDVAIKAVTYRKRAKHVGVALKPKHRWSKRSFADQRYTRIEKGRTE